jgi:hypothetical protein
MKNIFSGVGFFMFFFLVQNCLWAQYDTIVYVNGTRQAAKIVEILDGYVKFKNPLDTLGPIFSLPIKQIQRFVFKNGLPPLNNASVKNRVKDSIEVKKDKDFKRTIIGVDIGQAFIQHLQFNVEYILKNKAIAICGYFNKSLLDDTDSSTYNKLQCKLAGGYCKNIYGGFDFKSYPFGQQKTSAYISLGAEIGNATQLYLVNSNGNGTLASYTQFVEFADKRYYNYHLSFGATWRVKKSFIIQYYFSFGLNQFRNADSQGSDFSPKIAGGLIIAGAL